MKLIHGDCRKYLFSCEPDSIDLTVTSPPYDNLRTYNNSSTWGWADFAAIAAGLWRVTKLGGVVVWVVGDATIKGSETGSSFRQALFFKECGFNLHDTMIYSKPSFSAVGALSTRYAPTFEYMFVFTKGSIATFNPIKDRKCKTNRRSNSKGTIRSSKGPMKRKSNEGQVRRTQPFPPSVKPRYSQRFNVWKINPQSLGSDHPAPFPEQLANDHIISWSNEGDVVFDPFLGSGTTGKMAKLLNREFIGIEISKEYIETARKRIEEA